MLTIAFYNVLFVFQFLASLIKSIFLLTKAKTLGFAEFSYVFFS